MDIFLRLFGDLGLDEAVLIENTSNTTGDMPNMAENTPNTTGNTSNMAENMLNATGNILNTAESDTVPNNNNHT